MHISALSRDILVLGSDVEGTLLYQYFELHLDSCAVLFSVKTTSLK